MLTFTFNDLRNDPNLNYQKLGDLYPDDISMIALELNTTAMVLRPKGSN